MYERLAGMTGTAETEASEFASTYNLHVVSVPTHRPMIRGDRADLIYKTEDAKFAACVDDIIERNGRGQPVLVGTVSVEKSEKLSRLLDKQGVAHEVLNAKQHHREAEIVTQAGRLGSVTVATNMAGRGVDILLGGNPEGLARRDLRAESLDSETPEGDRRLAELTAKHQAAPPTPSATRCSSSEACTCSVPSATRAAASTTSSGAVPGARATPGRAASTCRWRTSS